MRAKHRRTEKTIAGVWTQGPNPLPLVLVRATPDTAWPMPEAPKPMPADANPKFDVVTGQTERSESTGQAVYHFAGVT